MSGANNQTNKKSKPHKNGHSHRHRHRHRHRVASEHRQRMELIPFHVDVTLSGDLFLSITIPLFYTMFDSYRYSHTLVFHFIYLSPYIQNQMYTTLLVFGFT